MRCLAFYDTRRTSQPRVVFNAMNDNTPDWQNCKKLFTFKIKKILMPSTEILGLKC